MIACTHKHFVVLDLVLVNENDLKYNLSGESEKKIERFDTHTEIHTSGLCFVVVVNLGENFSIFVVVSKR